MKWQEVVTGLGFFGLCILAGVLHLMDAHQIEAIGGSFAGFAVARLTPPFKIGEPK